MRQLVFDFVERLLQQEEIEQTIRALNRPRPESRIGLCFSVVPKKGRHGPLAPAIKRVGDLSMLVARRLYRALERGGPGIVDGTDETGHIACRRSLAPPILEAAAGLTFEIDDFDIVLHDQHLSEMKIAVMTNLRGVEIFGQQFSQPRAQRSTVNQQPVS